MTLCTVSKKDISVEKDGPLGVIFQNVIYTLSLDDFPDINLQTRYGMYLPDTFELDVSSETPIHKVCSDIFLTINSISIKLHEDLICPNCGSKLNMFINNYSCLNIDCIMSRNIVAILRYKLQTLVPRLPIQFFKNLINVAIARNIQLTVSSLYKLAQEMSTDPNCDIKIEGTTNFIEQLNNLSFSQFLYVVKSQYPAMGNDIRYFIEYYNDDLRQAFSGASKLYAFGDLNVSNTARHFMIHIMRVNKHFLDLILN